MSHVSNVVSSFYSFLKSTHHTNKQLEPTRTQQSNYACNSKVKCREILKIILKCVLQDLYANFTQKFSQTVIKCTLLRYSFFLKKKKIITHKQEPMMGSCT